MVRQVGGTARVEPDDVARVFDARERGVAVRSIARQVGLSPATLYNLLKLGREGADRAVRAATDPDALRERRRLAGASRAQRHKQMVSCALGESVESVVRSARADGMTWAQVAELVTAKSDGRVNVHPTTLLRWYPDPTVGAR